MKRWMFIILAALAVSGCSGENEEEEGTSISELQEPSEIKNAKEYTITAAESDWELDQDKRITAWTYNGSVPGEEIRVKEGENVRVKLVNELKEPVTIHWHGVVLPNAMDGVAGVTQNAVQPGETFMYEFTAEEAGTYWYHSHQQSSKQVDKGLYGAFIVEEEENTYDSDKVLIFDEWALDGSGSQGMMGMMGGMMNGGMDNGDMDTYMSYNTLSINGKTGNAIAPIEAGKGDKVRLRLINAGYGKRTLSFNGQEYKVVGNDGKKVRDGELTAKQLEIAPGERIDVEYTATASSWKIEESGGSLEATIPVTAKGDAHNDGYTASSQEVLSFAGYGNMEPLFDSDIEPDLEYNMDLGVSMGMMQGGMEFTINDETFPDTENIDVKKGDIIKVNLYNDSMLDHPMHLHGHHFQIVSKNGRKLDTPMVKDLINVKPGESYEIIFKADNPGHWLFHCHDLVHAGNGMVSVIKYDGVYSPYELEGKFHNEPE